MLATFASEIVQEKNVLKRQKTQPYIKVRGFFCDLVYKNAEELPSQLTQCR